MQAAPSEDEIGRPDGENDIFKMASRWAKRQRKREREGGEEEAKTDDEEVEPVHGHEDPFCPTGEEGVKEVKQEIEGQQKGKRKQVPTKIEETDPDFRTGDKSRDEEDGAAHKDNRVHMDVCRAVSSCHNHM